LVVQEAVYESAAKRMPVEFTTYTVAPEVVEMLARETEPYQPGVEPR
jgi:hypothetical protein